MKRALLLCLLSGSVVCRPRASNDITPRKQWEANFGYCGETSMIQSCLYYGVCYLSQFNARELGSSEDQATQGSQLLLGANAGEGFRAAGLEVTEKNEPNDEVFLSWVKGEIIAGRPVVIGLFIKGLTDPDYDHIVTVVGFESDFELTDASYHASDTLVFDDHFGPLVVSPAFSSFVKSRTDANANSAPQYSLTQGAMFGLSVLGPIVPAGASLLHARIAPSVTEEIPVMDDGASAPPDSFDMTLAVTVSSLTAGQKIVLCEYSSAGSVPTTNAQELSNCFETADEFFGFEVSATNAGTVSVSRPISSQDKRFYRAVQVNELPSSASCVSVFSALFFAVVVGLWLK